MTHVIKPIGLLPSRKKSDSIITTSIKIPPVASPDTSPFSIFALAETNPPINALMYSADLPKSPKSLDGSSMELLIQPNRKIKHKLVSIAASKPFTQFLKNNVCKKIHPFVKTSFD